MTRKRLDELGALQQAVMDVIWDRGEATVQQVLAVMSKEKPLAYTTVLSVLQKLERAGWVKHRSEGRSYMYSARRSRAEEGAKSLRSFIDGVFGGDPTLLFQSMISDDRMDEATLAELRAMLESKRKELGDGP